MSSWDKFVLVFASLTQPPAWVCGTSLFWFSPLWLSPLYEFVWQVCPGFRPLWLSPLYEFVWQVCPGFRPLWLSPLYEFVRQVCPGFRPLWLGPLYEFVWQVCPGFRPSGSAPCMSLWDKFVLVFAPSGSVPVWVCVTSLFWFSPLWLSPLYEFVGQVCPGFRPLWLSPCMSLCDKFVLVFASLAQPPVWVCRTSLFWFSPLWLSPRHEFVGQVCSCFRPSGSAPCMSSWDKFVLVFASLAQPPAWVCGTSLFWFSPLWLSPLYEFVGQVCPGFRLSGSAPCMSLWDKFVLVFTPLAQPPVWVCGTSLSWFSPLWLSPLYEFVGQACSGFCPLWIRPVWVCGTSLFWCLPPLDPPCMSLWDKHVLFFAPLWIRPVWVCGTRLFWCLPPLDPPSMSFWDKRVLVFAPSGSALYEFVGQACSGVCPLWIRPVWVFGTSLFWFLPPLDPPCMSFWDKLVLVFTPSGSALYEFLGQACSGFCPLWIRPVWVCGTSLFWLLPPLDPPCMSFWDKLVLVFTPSESALYEFLGQACSGFYPIWIRPVWVFGTSLFWFLLPLDPPGMSLCDKLDLVFASFLHHHHRNPLAQSPVWVCGTSLFWFSPRLSIISYRAWWFTSRACQASSQ